MKKSFCDGWDNLLSVIITNVIILFASMGCIFLFSLTAKLNSALLVCVCVLFTCVVISILVFAYGDSAAQIANFNGIRIVDYFKAIPSALKDGALFGLMIGGIGILSFFCFNYYFLTLFLESNNYLGIFLGGIILWLDIFLFLALQWFLPIRSLMHNNFKKCLKKSLIIFFDNTGFSILVGLYNILCFVISIFCVGFIPAWAGTLINNTNALRIRLYKYDYLEEHPELKTKKERRQIPWEELIYEDREALGPRKFKSFIFPWKDDAK